MRLPCRFYAVSRLVTFKLDRTLIFYHFVVAGLAILLLCPTSCGSFNAVCARGRVQDRSLNDSGAVVDEWSKVESRAQLHGMHADSRADHVSWSHVHIVGGIGSRLLPASCLLKSRSSSYQSARWMSLAVFGDERVYRGACLTMSLRSGRTRIGLDGVGSFCCCPCRASFAAELTTAACSRGVLP